MSASDTPILEVEGLSVRFGKFVALNNVTTRFEAGRLSAIIGPNGAGKSTFFNCLTGVLAPSRGRVLFQGEDITGLPQYLISHKGLARSYQITNIMPGLTCFENVRVAVQSRKPGLFLFSHHLSHRDILEKTEAVIEAVGLRGKEAVPAASLSHGEQRDLEIGIALATDPKLLLLDEPTAGMSSAETHETMELIRRIARQVTILIVEHDMEVVMGLAQRITVLHYGEVLAEGTPEETQANPKVLEVYLKG